MSKPRPLPEIGPLLSSVQSLLTLANENPNLDLDNDLKQKLQIAITTTQTKINNPAAKSIDILQHIAGYSMPIVKACIAMATCALQNPSLAQNSEALNCIRAIQRGTPGIISKDILKSRALATHIEQQLNELDELFQAAQKPKKPKKPGGYDREQWSDDFKSAGTYGSHASAAMDDKDDPDMPPRNIRRIPR